MISYNRIKYALKEKSQVQVELDILVPVREPEAGAQWASDAVVGISQASSPYAFPLEQLKQVVVMESVIRYQRYIMILTYSLSAGQLCDY